MLFTFVILLSAVTLKCLKSFDLVGYKLSLSRGLIYRRLVPGTRLMANSFYFCEKNFLAINVEFIAEFITLNSSKPTDNDELLSGAESHSCRPGSVQ